MKLVKNDVSVLLMPIRSEYLHSLTEITFFVQIRHPFLWILYLTFSRKYETDNLRCPNCTL